MDRGKSLFPGAARRKGAAFGPRVPRALAPCGPWEPAVRVSEKETPAEGTKAMLMRARQTVCSAVCIIAMATFLYALLAGHEVLLGDPDTTITTAAEDRR